MRPRQTHRGRRGFVLIDALVALALLSGAVTVYVVFFQAATLDQRRTEETFAAQLLAESEIERLRALPWDAIPLGADQPVASPLPAAKRLPDARITLTVTELTPGLKQAVARVSWRWRTGARLRVDLSAAFARRAPAAKEAAP